ncbi:ribonuclease H-like domain-containing protein [Trichoderma chlorosporum]
MVDALTELPNKTPSIYIDLKGVNLGRDGTISILQIFVHPTRKTYLLDVQTLEHTAFTMPGKTGQTLKDILESPLIPKVFFDVRRVADALFALFDISLYGVLDIQLMEFATRDDARGRGKYVRRLEKCVSFHSPLSRKEKIKWKKTENQGKHLFAPHLGGRYQIFTERPLQKDVIKYCVQNVSVMPGLWAYYSSKITAEWMKKVVVASRERVWTSNAIDYYPMGKLMALAPLSFLLPKGLLRYCF